MVPRRFALLACSIACLGLLAGVGAADPGVALTDPPDDETVGDVVELTVSVPENDTATVVVTASGGGAYSRTVRVNDTSGDGRVTVRLNTFRGQRNDTAYSAGDGDTATVTDRAGGRLSASTYDIAVYDGASTSGEPADTASVELTEPTDGTVSYLSGPAYASSRLETPADIRQGQTAGWLTDSSEVTVGETLVVALDVDGLGGALAASEGDTERFLAMLDRGNASLRVVKESGPQAVDPRFRLNRSSVDTVVADRANGSYYVVLDTAEVPFTPARTRLVDDGDDLHPRLVVDGEHRLSDDPSDIEEVELQAAEGERARDGFAVAVADVPENGTLGDVVELGVWLPDNETATVVIEATGADAYGRTVRLTDASGDGRVRLRVNTFLASQGAADAAVYSVGGGDNVTVRENVGSAMPARKYSVAVYGGPTTDGEAVNSSVTLAEPTDGSASVSVAAPNASDRLDTCADIQRARSEGWLTESAVATGGDTLVLDLRVDGLGGALAAADGDNDSERFLSLLDRADTSLWLEWGATPMTYPEQLNLSRTNVETVVADSRNDSYAVVVDTADVGLVPSTNRSIEDGDSFELHFSVADRQRLEGDTEFDLEEPAAELSWSPRVGLDGDTVRVDGRTNVAPGTRIGVHLTGTDTNVTTVTRTARSNDWSEFNVTVPADTLTEADSVRVRRDGPPVETDTQRIRLSVPSDQSVADGELRVPSVWLPADGYVHVVGPTDTVVGRSDELRGERDHNVTIPLSLTEVGPDESLVVVPSEEATIDPEELDYYDAFFVDGAPPGVTVNVTTVSEPATQTPTETTTPTSTATPSGTATATTAADGPGFGVLAALLAGLLALVAVGARSR